MKLRMFKACLVALGVMASAPAWSDTQAARIIVPFSAGGPADSVVRLTMKYLSNTWGRTIVVENKPGATGLIGVQHVAKAKPDGLTLLAGTKSAMASGPLLNPSVTIDPTTDFIPIDLVAKDELLLIASSELPVDSVGDLIELAKSKPGSLNYGTSGHGSSYHFDTELFSSLVGIKMTHIPYKGAAPAFQDLLAGRIDVQLQTFSQIWPHLGASKFKVLGVASANRLPELPDVPTLSEATGIPPFEAAVWTGIFVPEGTPGGMVGELRAALRKVSANPEFQKSLEAMGLRSASGDPDEIAHRFAADIKAWKEMVDSGRVGR